MQAEPVDPTDTSWELREPAYRVYFWSTPEDLRAAPTSYEWRLTDAAAVHEVLDWAERERADRSYELFVEHRERRQSREGWTDEPGLIRLSGTNPADGRSYTIRFRRPE